MTPTSECVNFATLLSRVGWSEKDHTPGDFGEDEQVIVLFSRREALKMGFPGWEFTKSSNDLYELKPLEEMV